MSVASLLGRQGLHTCLGKHNPPSIFHSVAPGTIMPAFVESKALDYTRLVKVLALVIGLYLPKLINPLNLLDEFISGVE